MEHQAVGVWLWCMAIVGSMDLERRGDCEPSCATIAVYDHLLWVQPKLDVSVGADGGP